MMFISTDDMLVSNDHFSKSVIFVCRMAVLLYLLMTIAFARHTLAIPSLIGRCPIVHNDDKASRKLFTYRPDYERAQ